MSVFRVQKNKNYTVMSNKHLTDKRLSLKTIGLLSLILSLPDSWDYSQAGLAQLCKDGEDSVRSGLKEMEKFGYLRRIRERDASGKLKGVIYHIYEDPQHCDLDNVNTASQTEDVPVLENPILANPTEVNVQQVNPKLECQGQLNTKQQITKIHNTINHSTNVNQFEHGCCNNVSAYNDLIERLKKDVGYEFFKFKLSQLERRFDEGDVTLEQYEQDSLQYDHAKVLKIVKHIADIVMSNEKSPIKIGDLVIDREVVEQKLLGVDFVTMKRVVFELNTNPNIKNPKNYAISMIYNS